MSRRLLPMLCASLLAGCATSEPPAVTSTMLPVVAPSMEAAPIVNSPTTIATDNSPAALTTAPSAMPPLETQASSAYGQTAASDGLAIGTGGTNCRTVGNATMCDAPADPYADFARNTN